jgi:hypothetical protein
VKEKRKGPIGRAAGLAEGVAATVRRMQREREPRVLVYDETGYARLVQPNGRGYERLLETAERMVALVSDAEADAKPRLTRRPEGGEEAKPRREEGKPRRARKADGSEEGKPRREEGKPRRARKADGSEEGKPRRAGRTEGAAEAKPRRPRPAKGSADAKKPRRPRRSAPEGGS